MGDEDGPSGNKGEWSEYYVLLKVLGDGRIYGADGDLRKKPDVYYDVNRVIRGTDGSRVDYVRDPAADIVRIQRLDGSEYEVEIPRIVSEYARLFPLINSGHTGERSFRVPEAAPFMREMQCKELKAPSTDKTDITIEIHERKTGCDLLQGFSIKSTIGAPSTLVNASGATNVVFAVEGDVPPAAVERHNRGVEDGTLTLRDSLKTVLAGSRLVYRDTDKHFFGDNLTLVDSDLPLIVAEMLKLYYCQGVTSVRDVVDAMKAANPLNYRHNGQLPYYEYKVKKLLVAYTVGMQSSKPWLGVEEANGGYIIVKPDGDVVCYHIFDRMDFEDYLVSNTRMDTPSTSRHHFGQIYEEDGELRIKLNLQIRFVCRLTTGQSVRLSV